MSETKDHPIPGKSELLDVLKESVQEVFTSMVFTFQEATVRQVLGSDGADLEVIGGAEKEELVHIQTEARVSFKGEIDGCVVLRCCAQGAMDIARGLLMMDESEAIELEEVADALGECANMVTGTVKTKALDPLGDFHMSTPEVIQSVAAIQGDQCGTLAYRLTQGIVSLEIWVDGIAA